MYLVDVWSGEVNRHVEMAVTYVPRKSDYIS